MGAGFLSAENHNADLIDMLFQVGVVDGVVMNDVEEVGEGKFFVEQGGKFGDAIDGVGQLTEGPVQILKALSPPLSADADPLDLSREIFMKSSVNDVIVYQQMSQFRGASWLSSGLNGWRKAIRG